jgi:hypothetical protein
MNRETTCLAEHTDHSGGELSMDAIYIGQSKPASEESTTNPLDIRQGRHLGCHVVEIVPDVQAEGRQACVPAMRHEEQ